MQKKQTKKQDPAAAMPAGQFRMILKKQQASSAKQQAPSLKHQAPRKRHNHEVK
jgi:hypothetical protein